MKVGIVGKGGTGKTTVSALVAQAYVAGGKRVLAVDTDSNPNLAFGLGVDPGPLRSIRLIPRALSVGTGDGQMSPAELVRDYGLSTPAGVTVLHAMAVMDAGAGCTCGSHASVRSLLGAAVDGEADVTVVDMEAGLEHLSRSGGTLAYADVLLAVMEPTLKSVVTAARTKVLAEELGLARVYAVGNKARRPEDATFFRQACEDNGLVLAGLVPFDTDVVEAEREGTALAAGAAQAARDAVAGIVAFIDSPTAEREALLRTRARLARRLAELERETAV